MERWTRKVEHKIEKRQFLPRTLLYNVPLQPVLSHVLTRSKCSIPPSQAYECLPEPKASRQDSSPCSHLDGFSPTPSPQQIFPSLCIHESDCLLFVSRDSEKIMQPSPKLQTSSLNSSNESSAN